MLVTFQLWWKFKRKREIYCRERRGLDDNWYYYDKFGYIFFRVYAVTNAEKLFLIFAILVKLNKSLGK